MSNLYDPYGHCLGHVNNFYYKLGETGVTFELDNGKTFRFNPGDFLRDRQGDWRIRKPEESILDSLRYSTWADRVMEEASKKKEAATMTAASIKKVIFNPPATVVYWSDGSKTVVKCNVKDNFDPEKGLAMAVAKRCAGNHGAYYAEIRHWVEKCWKGNPNKPCTAEHSANLDAVKASIEKMNHNFDDLIDGAVAGNPARFIKKLCEMKANLAVMEQELYK